jgi:hypothetical protein
MECQVSIISQARSFFSGQSREEFGEGQRHPLSKTLEKSIRRNVASLRGADLSGYQFERRPSEQKDAKSDLVIYNENQKPVLFGRDMYGDTSFWEK